MATESNSLGHYAKAFLARRWSIVGGAIVGGLLALLVLLLWPATFTARTQVLIPVNVANPFDVSRAQSAYIDAATETSLIHSSAVAERVAESLQVSVEEARAASGGTLLPNSTVMEVSYQAPTRELAIVGADAVARAYIDARQGIHDKRANSRLARIDSELASLNESLITLEHELAAASAEDSETQRRQADRVALQAQISTLLNERVEVLILDNQGGSILASARANPIDREPNRPIMIASGAVLGALIVASIPLLGTGRKPDLATGASPVHYIADRVPCFAMTDICVHDDHWAAFARELLVETVQPTPAKIAIVGQAPEAGYALTAVERVLRDDGIRVAAIADDFGGFDRGIRRTLREADPDTTTLVQVASLRRAQTDAAARLSDGLIVVAGQSRIAQVTAEIQQRGHRVFAAISLGDNHPVVESVSVGGVRVDCVSMNQAIQIITGWCRQPGSPRLAVGVNAHVCNQAASHAAFANLIAAADLAYPDGRSVVWAGRSLGGQLDERVATTDMIWPLAQVASEMGLSMFFFGSAPGVAQRAADRIRERYPLSIECADGYGQARDDLALVERINASGADILLVGLGDPRQQQWVAAHRDCLRVRTILTCGGLFDWTSGKNPRPPAWMTSAGLEWAWRLRLEPGRLAGRYLLGNPRFLFRIARQRMTGKVSNRPRHRRTGR